MDVKSENAIKSLFCTGTKVFQLGLGTFVSYNGALEAGPSGGV